MKLPMPSPAPAPPAPATQWRPPELVVVAASQGGIAALRALFARLPNDFPVPIAVVLHRTPTGREIAPTVLARSSALPLKLAAEGEAPRPGTIYLAPAGQHLVLRADRTFHLMDGRRIQHAISSANPLFQSAAYSLDGRVVGVVLTGGGTNGQQGVLTISGMGGTVIAQDPETAEAPSMPRAAIASGGVDYVLPLADIPDRLVRLVSGPQERDFPYGKSYPAPDSGADGTAST